MAYAVILFFSFLLPLWPGFQQIRSFGFASFGSFTSQRVEATEEGQGASAWFLVPEGSSVCGLGIRVCLPFQALAGFILVSFPKQSQNLPGGLPI